MPSKVQVAGSGDAVPDAVPKIVKYGVPPTVDVPGSDSKTKLSEGAKALSVKLE